METLTPDQLAILLQVYRGIQPGDVLVTVDSELSAVIKKLLDYNLLRFDGKLCITPRGVDRIMYALGDDLAKNSA